MAINEGKLTRIENDTAAGNWKLGFGFGFGFAVMSFSGSRYIQLFQTLANSKTSVFVKQAV